MKLFDVLQITESCMVVTIYDSKVGKVIYTGRVDECLKTYDGRLDRKLLHINHSEINDAWDIEYVI